MNLDISGSMSSSGTVSGIPSLTAREVTAAMAMAYGRTEPNVEYFGFSHNLIPLKISPKKRLDDVLKVISGLPFGSTNCAAPFEYATANKLKTDNVIIMTDNETNGYFSPASALRNYRSEVNANAKLVVCATMAVDFSIADPKDANSLDVSGFDTSVPTLITDFFKN